MAEYGKLAMKAMGGATVLAVGHCRPAVIEGRVARPPRPSCSSSSPFGAAK